LDDALLHGASVGGLGRRSCWLDVGSDAAPHWHALPPPASRREHCDMGKSERGVGESPRMIGSARPSSSEQAFETLQEALGGASRARAYMDGERRNARRQLPRLLLRKWKLMLALYGPPVVIGLAVGIGYDPGSSQLPLHIAFVFGVAFLSYQFLVMCAMGAALALVEITRDSGRFPRLRSWLNRS
jgi:hypothetical protein